MRTFNLSRGFAAVMVGGPIVLFGLIAGAGPGEPALTDNVTLEHLRRSICGPVALCLASRQLGAGIPFEACVQDSGADEHGTSFEGLARAARKHGLSATALELSSPDWLLDMPQNARAILHVDGDHFILVGSAGRHEIEVADYPFEVRRGPLSILSDYETGSKPRILLIQPKSKLTATTSAAGPGRLRLLLLAGGVGSVGFAMLHVYKRIKAGRTSGS